MKKLLCLTVVGLMLLTSISIVYGVGTPYGTRLTNTAIVTGANFSKVTKGIGTNVQRIVGGHWVGEADTSVSAGAVVTNTTYLTNLGNAIFTFRIRVTNFTAGGGAANWRWSIYTNGIFTTPYLANQYGNGSEGGNLILNTNSVARIDLVVYVTNTATSGHYNEFWLMARVIESKQNTHNYQGDNNLWYGGPQTEGWGVKIPDRLICYGPSSDTNWRVSIQAPNISITKSIVSISNINDPNGPDNVAVPGATITYRVYVSNSGASGTGTANSVIIRDTLPSTNYISFVTGSTTLEAGSAAGFKFAYAISGENPIVYCSNLSTGALPPNGRVSFTYRVIIK